MKKVLITGASSALGKGLEQHLRILREQYEVLATSRRSGPSYLDVCDRAQVFEFIERVKPDIIIHLAATFSAEFNDAYSTNVLSAKFICESVLEQGLDTRVVLTGSAAEYGVIRPEENPVSEDRVLRPVSIYGITKAWQSELAYLYASWGVDVVVARVFNLAGAGLSQRLFFGRIQHQIGEILRGTASKIEVGPLSAVRDYISIEEAAQQFVSILELGSRGNVYHVASGRPITMREVLVEQLAKFELEDVRIAESAALSNRRGYDVPMIYADMSRTNKLFERRSDDARN